MQLFKYMTLTLCQQQRTDDVLFRLKVNKITSQTGLLKKIGKISKEYAFNTKLLYVSLILSQCISGNGIE